MLNLYSIVNFAFQYSVQPDREVGFGQIVGVHMNIPQLGNPEADDKVMTLRKDFERC